MSTMRFKAIELAQSRPIVEVKAPAPNVTEYFGLKVFTHDKMKKTLPINVYDTILHSVETGASVDRKVAGHVAEAMQTWAISNGATHYTHWFQPLTGATAEKHDTFFETNGNGKAIEAFSASALVQQEPDASSFPSGGLRNTFEARGYTAWDPSSPAFLMENINGTTLCIPTIFVSYTGEALDYKTPLLKAVAALDKAATAICKYFDPKVTKVIATLGVEQEYFLVDRALYFARPDLLTCGRAFIGATPAKGQQLEDHYFGSIPDRVYSFMKDMETEAYKLGIPLKTRHNEVAPSQFECAPIFEELNIAIDHNQLLMDLMDKISVKHNFKVLLHEKPYSRINGSGKHNNWSMMTNTHKNLFSPGKNPADNLWFLTIFISTIKAVYEHDDLLRASIASAGNDYRLGANEAPPAIISVFVGEQLTKVLDDIENNKTNNNNHSGNKSLGLGIPKIPEILLDNTDRNRTSPFAFTGNKFEFRAVGSSDNSSSAMTVLNTIVANQFSEFKKEVDQKIKSGKEKESAILDVLRSYITTSKKIIFGGNNYSDEWAVEAKKRGLNNIKSTPHALDAYISKKSVELFLKHKIFSEREMHARHEMRLENYIKKIQIEARILGDLALTHVIPSAVTYLNQLFQTIEGMKKSGIAKKMAKPQIELAKEIAERIAQIKTAVTQMTEKRKKVNNMTDTRKKANAYCEEVKETYFDTITYHCNKLEHIVPDELWPLPKYREMLFVR